MSDEGRFDLNADELLVWREHRYSVKALVQTIMRLRANAPEDGATD